MHNLQFFLLIKKYVLLCDFSPLFHVETRTLCLLQLSQVFSKFFFFFLIMSTSAGRNLIVLSKVISSKAIFFLL